MFDRESELARAKWVLAALVLLLVSLCVTYQEFNYLVRGRKAEAKITQVNEITTKRGSIETGKHLEVWYEFNDEAGLKRENKTNESTTWNPPSSGTLTVYYLPDNGGSRTGGLGWYWFCFVAIALAILGLVGYRFWRNIQAELSDKPKRKK